MWEKIESWLLTLHIPFVLAVMVFGLVLSNKGDMAYYHLTWSRYLSWSWPLLLLGTAWGAQRGFYKPMTVAVLIAIAILIAAEGWFNLPMYYMLKLHGI